MSALITKDTKRSKKISMPMAPWKPTEPQEFLMTTVTLGTIIFSDEDEIALEDFDQRLATLVKNKDRKNVFLRKSQEYGYYDEPDRYRTEVCIRVNKRNPRYKTELKKYEKELVLYKTDLKIYKQKYALYISQQTAAEVVRLEKEIEEVKAGKVAKQLEKQLKQKQDELSRLAEKQDEL